MRDNKEREHLFKKKEPIDRKLTKNHTMLKHLNDELSMLEIVEPKTLSEKIDYFLFEDGQVTGVRYKERDKFWHDFCGDDGLIKSGYYHETRQVSLSIKMTYGSEKSLKNHIEQIIELLPHIFQGKDGYKHFGIFEHTLCRSHSYDLLINEETKEYIVSIDHRANNDFKSLNEALEYIQIHNWYDGKEEDQEYDDPDYDD